MNPETKLILEELHKRFTAHDLKWDQRFEEQEQHFRSQIQELQQAQDLRVLALEKAFASFDEWRPSIEGTVDSIRLEVKKLSLGWERSSLSQPEDQSGVYAAAPSASAPSASAPAASPVIGPGVAHQYRENGMGVVTTLVRSPVKGESYHPRTVIPAHVDQFHAMHPSGSDPSPFDSHGPPSSKIPKVDFPKFDGEHPKSWLRDCLDYFALYRVESTSWVRIARMHFVGAARRWYNSVESQLHGCNWDTLSNLIMDRFGKDHHELLLRHLFQIRQTGTVAEYIDQFSTIVDQLGAYHRTTDPLFYTMRFIDGLKDHIRAAVALHRPQTWDTACVLAQLQEDLSAPRKLEVRKWDVSSGTKPFARSPLPPPPLPAHHDKAGAPLNLKSGPEVGRSLSADERWAALRSSRRAQGLCIKCGERWSRDHRCAKIAAVDELLALFGPEEDTDDQVTELLPEPAEVQMMLSVAALSGTSSARTMHFAGQLGTTPIRILLDSGSTHTFISTTVAARCHHLLPLDPPIQVKVANGQLLSCSHYVPAAVWSIQGLEFTNDLKVLDLPSYDMILGVDWLASHSPMQIHWAHQWLQIPYHHGTVQLRGDLSSLPAGTVIQLQSVEPPVQAQSPDWPPDIQQLLQFYANLFETPSQLPPSRSCDHTIPLVPGAGPVFSRPYRFAPAVKDEIEKQVHEMLAAGLIRKSSSPFSSPVLLVKKKDQSWRFCVDYRQLNSITLKSKYPVPLIDELLDELGGASWFSKLDLRSGFHQILLQPGEEFKTAFQTHFGQFEFVVMPFGLTGAPGTFQEAMNSTLAPFLRKFVLVFFDDILIYSHSYADHLQHIKQVMELLQANHWKLKLSKCEFAKSNISYLGHVITGSGVTTDPEKVTAVTSWTTPTSVKDVRSFLGLPGYYRKFVRNFGIIARPLTELLRKNTIFRWTSSHDQSFQALKQALVSAPVLALPNFSRPFSIETDASAGGIGAVLLQDGHPLAYISRALGPRSKGLSTYEKEYMAIILAVQQWRQYLQFAEFTIFTDQQSLVQLTDQRLHTPWQHKFFTKLLGLQYRIVYKPGSTNRAADALSRQSNPVASCAAISSVTPQWIQEVLDSYTNDVTAKALLSKLSIDPNSVPGFSLRQGILRYHDRIWVGADLILQQKLMHACHSSAIGGHSGFPATYMRMKRLFAWKGMKSALRAFVTSCVTCQRAKPDRARLPGLLQPLPVPDSAWQIISLDFVEGLPCSNRANYILVIVDSFTKYAHFVAQSVAKVFLNQVYRLHGLPTAIISDRDRIFTSKFWSELFRLADVKLQMSSSYHPQSDGQTERLNQSMETFLRCFVNACLSKWCSWLPLAEFWYNSTHHSAVGRSPFEALYGYMPRHFGISAVDSIEPRELADWLNDRQVMTDLIHQHLSRAKERMKRQADKKRSERQFQIGDMVFVKLQLYVQTTLAHRAHQKLAFKYFGPFLVLARVGSVAYTLQLPESSAVHPTFHVSQLKKAVLPGTVISPTFPSDIELPRVPVAILQRRPPPAGATSGDQVLVQWSGWPRTMATWESFEALRQAFPRAPAWGQAGPQAPGNVSSAPHGPHQGGPGGPRRSVRVRRPNKRVIGDSWA